MIRTGSFSILAILLAAGSASANSPATSSLDLLRALDQGAPIGVIATDTANSAMRMAADDDDDDSSDDDSDA